MTDSRSPASRASRTLVFQALLLSVVAGAGGFLAYRLTRTQPSTVSVAPAASSTASGSKGSDSSGRAAATGPASPSGQAEGPVRQIPEVLPQIALTDSAGVRRRLSEWKGRPLVINFWATWCEPCRREIPLLQRLRRDRSADGIEVIGIAVDFREAVLKYAQSLRIDYPLLIGEQDALEAVSAFGMDTVLPFTVFADSQGRIVTLKVGELHADEADLILSRVGELGAGRIDLRAAREQIATGIRQLAAARARSETVPARSTPQGS